MKLRREMFKFKVTIPFLDTQNIKVYRNQKGKSFLKYCIFLKRTTIINLTWSHHVLTLSQEEAYYYINFLLIINKERKRDEMNFLLQQKKISTLQ